MWGRYSILFIFLVLSLKQAHSDLLDRYSAKEPQTHDQIDDLDVIYGLDDRVLVQDLKDKKLKQMGEAVLAMVAVERLQRQGDYYVIKANSEISAIESRFGLCSEDNPNHIIDDKFRKNISLSVCTGFVVSRPTMQSESSIISDQFFSDQFLVTASHCAFIGPLSDYVFVQGFRSFKSADLDWKQKIPLDKVYTPEKVITFQFPLLEGDPDIATIQLNREHPNPISLPDELDGATETYVGSRVTTLGHPGGMGLVASSNTHSTEKPSRKVGQVISQKISRTNYVFNGDVWVGNSGSPVIDLDSYQVLGVLGQGEPDFLTTSSGCKVQKVCQDDLSDCLGEDMTSIKALSNLQ